MNNVKALRKNAGMTQRQFAEYFGVPLATLRKWELPETSAQRRRIPPYLLDLMRYKLQREGKIK